MNLVSTLSKSTARSPNIFGVRSIYMLDALKHLDISCLPCEQAVCIWQPLDRTG